MFNLLNALRKREITGTSHEIKSWMNQKIQNNILQDKSTTDKIDFQTHIFKVGHSNNYLATLRLQNELFLFDTSFSERLWSIPVTNLENYQCAALIVSNTGLVLYIAKDIDVFSQKIPQVQIFLDGKQTGSFMIEDDSFLLRSLKIINNRIFGISQSKLYEWNMDGNLVQSISMDILKGTSGSTIATSDDYFVVAAQNKGKLDKFPIFIFNLQDNTCQELHLNPSNPLVFQVDEEIDSICLLGEKLIIGAHEEIALPKYSLNKSINPNIQIIELQTGKRIHKFTPDKERGKIQHLQANNNFIIFLNYEGAMTGDFLYSINLVTNTINKIKQVPYCLDGELTLDLNNSLLTVCSPKGYWNSGRATVERSVIELDKNKIGHQIQYKRFPGHAPFFSSNAFIIATSCTSEKSLYIERFNEENNRSGHGLR